MRGYRNEQGKSRSRIVEKLSNEEYIKKTYHVEDARAWCEEYAKRKTAEAKQLALSKNRKVTIKLAELEPKADKSAIFNVGYLILDAIYHQFGLANICEEIRLKHPHVKGFNLNNVLRTMLFGRILKSLL
ncbi:MAG: hypothetical protein K6F05_02005 [Succinivibrio sp.]|nr:hypothetical protein [Succinivibrio sp.]